MRKTLLIIATVALLGMVAAYTYPAGQKAGPSSTAAVVSPAPSQTTSTATASSPAATAGSSAQVTGQYKDGTYTGGTYSSDYGDVQVSLTISGGKIASVSLPRLTEYDQHSREIDGYAVPLLKQQTLQAQSATIDGVSGATYTSSSYMRSLQSAIDKAKA